MKSWTNLGIYILALLGGTPESLFDQQETQTTPISPVGYVPHQDTKELSTSDLVPFTFPNTTPAPGVYNSTFNTDNIHNNPTSRRSWTVGQHKYSIETDYDDIDSIPETGVTHQIPLYITLGERFCGDGFCRQTQLINGTYPGPLIRGKWGDWFNFTVHNNLHDCNGTSIHWHGIRQFRTVYADGVPGVTECPLAPGKQKNYIWRATQYGSGWYHSHFSLQYSNGIAGPLVIDGPTSENFDEDKGPLMLADWYHGNAFSLYHEHIFPTDNVIGPSSFLINGQGNFTKFNNESRKLEPGCSPSPIPSPDDPCQLQYASTHATYIEFGKVYKYRIINISTQTSFRFWIDNHNFTLVAIDYVPIEPVPHLPSIDVAIGQRYDILIEGKSKTEPPGPNNFWINVRGCAQTCYHDDPSNKTRGVVECRQGLLRYQPDDETLPADYPDQSISGCRDITHTRLKPVVKRDLRSNFTSPMKFGEAFLVDSRKQTQNFTKVHGLPWGEGLWTLQITKETEDGFDGDKNDEFDDDENDEFDDDESDEFDDDENDELDERKLVRRAEADPMLWNFGIANSSNEGTPEPYQSLMIDWSFPTIWYSSVVGEGLPGRGMQNSSENRRYAPFLLGSNGQWQIFVIAGDWPSSQPHAIPLMPIPGAAHPIHLHGHDSVILYQSNTDEAFEFGKEYPLNLDNPARRDVIMLPAKGIIIIGFRADNPGAWLMHCHIAWHASAGLSMQFIEGPEKVADLMDRAEQDAFLNTCKEWRAHESSHCEFENQPAQQDDSGI